MTKVFVCIENNKHIILSINEEKIPAVINRMVVGSLIGKWSQTGLLNYSDKQAQLFNTDYPTIVFNPTVLQDKFVAVAIVTVVDSVFLDRLYKV